MNAQVHTTKAPTERTIKASESAAQALDGLQPGDHRMILTFGQFSLGDAIRALLPFVGPCHMTISTWTAAQAEIDHAWRLLSEDRIQSMRWLVDRSFLTRQPKYARALIERFGEDAIRTTRTHAKFVTMRGDNIALAIQTSCNLNANPRLEMMSVTVDDTTTAWLESIVDSLWQSQESAKMSGELPPVDAMPGAAPRGSVTTGPLA